MTDTISIAEFETLVSVAVARRNENRTRESSAKKQLETFLFRMSRHLAAAPVPGGEAALGMPGSSTDAR